MRFDVLISIEPLYEEGRFLLFFAPIGLSSLSFFFLSSIIFRKICSAMIAVVVAVVVIKESILTYYNKVRKQIIVPPQ